MADFVFDIPLQGTGSFRAAGVPHRDEDRGGSAVALAVKVQANGSRWYRVTVTLPDPAPMTLNPEGLDLADPAAKMKPHRGKLVALDRGEAAACAFSGERAAKLTGEHADFVVMDEADDLRPGYRFPGDLRDADPAGDRTATDADFAAWRATCAAETAEAARGTAFKSRRASALITTRPDPTTPGTGPDAGKAAATAAVRRAIREDAAEAARMTPAAAR